MTSWNVYNELRAGESYPKEFATGKQNQNSHGQIVD